jgi:hypothetical protein
LEGLDELHLARVVDGVARHPEHEVTIMSATPTGLTALVEHPPRTTAADWCLLVVPGVIWGASFLFIAEGLRAIGPNGVTFVRILVGFATLAFLPSARRAVPPPRRSSSRRSRSSWACWYGTSAWRCCRWWVAPFVCPARGSSGGPRWNRTRIGADNSPNVSSAGTEPVVWFSERSADMTKDTALAAWNTLRLIASLASIVGVWLGYETGRWPILLMD